MTKKYSNYISLVFLLLLFLALSDILITYKNLALVRKSDFLVDHTYQVRVELERTLTTLVSSETGQRGYLITRDDKFLEPYNQSVPIVQVHLNKLKDLTKDNKEQQKRLAQLSGKVHERLDYLKKGIDLTQNQSYNSQEAFTLVGKGRVIMNDVRSLVGEMDSEEAILLMSREKESENTYNNVLIGSYIAGFLNVIFIIIAFYLIKWERKRRDELEKNKDEFINMASHELKTPVTSMKIYANVMERKIDKAPLSELHQYVKKIDEQTNKLASLIANLLDLSRIQTGKVRIDKEPFDMNTLIDETVEAMQATTSEHKIIIKSSIKKLIYGDRYRIYQVIVNLLTNAIKYSPRGGKIIITNREMKTHVEICIQDEGIGIDKEHLSKIFDRLYQVPESKENTYPGLGIGLYITADIIKRHKGEIWVKSNKGKGSSFYFTLPYVE